MTKLRPGDQRVHTALKIFVEFSEGTTFRIPTRESSKVGLFMFITQASG